MNILGISGLHNSVHFKKRVFPELDARDAKIATGHDSAAALVTDDGMVAAAAEERFSRQKGTGRFPVGAIEFCLNHARLNWNKVDFIAHGFAYEPVRDFFMRLSEFERTRFEEVYSLQSQLQSLREFIPDAAAEKFHSVPHHIAHAASAFYPSGMDESLILVSDGMGEIHSCTVAIGTSSGIETIKTIPSLHSLGMLYSIVTLHLGFFMSSDEYKVMGLAPYGRANKTLGKFAEMVKLNPDGTYVIPCLLESGTDLEQETLAHSRKYMESCFGPSREPESDLTQAHMDIAAGMQAILQIALVHLLRHCRRETGLTNLCMAGGVSLNCVANGVIARSGLFKNVFVQPASGDDGTALGAALHLRKMHRPTQKLARMRVPYLGPAYLDGEIEKELNKHAECSFEFHENEDSLIKLAARDILQGKVVAWFQGRMEYGPRALGARSILADPTSDTMREHINALVKKRENFRPFAPAVTEEDASEIFHIAKGKERQYENMLFVTQVKEKYRNRLPAITHVDGSARVQVVSNDENSRFYRLIKAVGEQNGVPVVLNTSFNVRGQAIVCEPGQAIETFLTAKLDSLIINSFYVQRAAGRDNLSITARKQSSTESI